MKPSLHENRSTAQAGCEACISAAAPVLLRVGPGADPSQSSDVTDPKIGEQNLDPLNPTFCELESPWPALCDAREADAGIALASVRWKAFSGRPKERKIEASQAVFPQTPKSASLDSGH